MSCKEENISSSLRKKKRKLKRW